VCQTRNARQILMRIMKACPVLARFIYLILRCVLLGTLPHAQSVPPLVVCARITATFSGRDPAALLQWVHDHPMLTVSLLREYLLCLTEADGVLDRVRGMATAWQRFKSLARHINGQWRQVVNAQILANPRAPVDWSSIEVCGPNDKMSTGNVLYWHNCLKPHFTKLRKGNEVEVMLRKMKAAIKELHKHHADAVAAVDMDAVYAWMRADGRLEALHVCAWQSAMALAGLQRVRAPVATRWLKALGMTAAGFADVRRWVHGFFEYNAKDNSFVRLATLMYLRAPTDFLLLKTYLRCIEYYGSDVVQLDPLSHTRLKLQALRSNLSIEPWSSTPEHLGMAHFCEGCLQWANAMVLPSYTLLNMPAAATAFANAQKKKKKKRPTLPLPVPLTLAHGRAACMKRAFYHPLNGQLYCRRAQFRRAAEDVEVMAAIGDEVPEEGAAAMIDDGDDPSTHEDEVVDEEISEDDEESDGDGSSGGGKGQSWLGRDIERPLLASAFSCDAPLVAVDLAGASKRLVHLTSRGVHLAGASKKLVHLTSRCAYCGMVCQALSCGMTNMGLSCNAHSEVGHEYPAWHRLWQHLGVERAACVGSSTTTSTASANLGPCLACRTLPQPSICTLDVYDYNFKLFKLPLCQWHVRECRDMVRPLSSGQWAAPPVRYDHLKLDKK